MHSSASLHLCLSIPLVGDRIFSHLSPSDLTSARFVSRHFYRSVLRYLEWRGGQADSRVTSVRLSGVYWLEETSLLRHLGPAGHALQALYLDSCWNVSHSALEKVVALCPCLRRLSLARIYSLSDASLEVIGRTLALLQWLNLRSCWRITDAGIR